MAPAAEEATRHLCPAGQHSESEPSGANLVVVSRGLFQAYQLLKRSWAIYGQKMNDGTFSGHNENMMAHVFF